MNDDAITDLKQFIAATISQQLVLQTAELKEDFKKLSKKVDQLEVKVDRLEIKTGRLEEFAEEADIKLNTIADAIGAKQTEDRAETNTRLDDHEIRLTRLETQSA